MASDLSAKTAKLILIENEKIWKVKLRFVYDPCEKDSLNPDPPAYKPKASRQRKNGKTKVDPYGSEYL